MNVFCEKVEKTNEKSKQVLKSKKTKINLAI